MISKSISFDEKTLNRIDMPSTAGPVVPENQAPAGVTVADLIHASAHGFAMIVRYVLMAGINPNQKDVQGRTALQVAATREIRELLLNAGAEALN